MPPEKKQIEEMEKKLAPLTNATEDLKATIAPKGLKNTPPSQEARTELKNLEEMNQRLLKELESNPPNKVILKAFLVRNYETMQELLAPHLGHPQTALDYSKVLKAESQLIQDQPERAATFQHRSDLWYKYAKIHGHT